MYTATDIQYKFGFLGGNVEATIPAGTPVVPAHNLPQGGYWVEKWEGMTYPEECWQSAYGFHVTEDQVSDPVKDEKLTALYLDWVNNFLTLEKFASHYGLSVEDAGLVIHQGRIIHQRNIPEKTK